MAAAGWGGRGNPRAYGRACGGVGPSPPRAQPGLVPALGGRGVLIFRVRPENAPGPPWPPGQSGAGVRVESRGPQCAERPGAGLCPSRGTACAGEDRAQSPSRCSGPRRLWAWGDPSQVLCRRGDRGAEGQAAAAPGPTAVRALEPGLGTASCHLFQACSGRGRAEQARPRRQRPGFIQGLLWDQAHGRGLWGQN